MGIEFKQFKVQILLAIADVKPLATQSASRVHDNGVEAKQKQKKKKWKNEKSNKIDNVPPELIPDTIMQIENMNRDGTTWFWGSYKNSNTPRRVKISKNNGGRDEYVHGAREKKFCKALRWCLKGMLDFFLIYLFSSLFLIYSKYFV